jgi:predicted transcriptional regulator
MVDDVTLAPETYDVLKMVPLGWASLTHTEQAIATATKKPLGDVRRRLTQLRGLKLIEYRRRQTIAPSFEVRRIAK